jgi:Icc-related predicted phosphoesterase
VRFTRRTRRKEDRDGTTIFFVTDVHGSEDCFRKFLNAARVYEADVLIVGGDITGKIVVPIVERADGRTTYRWAGVEREVSGVEGIFEAERILRRSGAYYFHTNEAELAAMNADPKRTAEITRQLVLERVASWVELAEERLGGTDVRLFICAGNDDIFEVDEILRSSSYVVNHDGSAVALDDCYTLAGLGYANLTPWDCPRDLPDPDLAVKIESLLSDVADPERCIFSMHVPPVDSQLDLCPKLDASEYPPRVITNAGGQPVMHGAGSAAVRAAIEKYQPVLSLHGHIHESRGATQIGRTLALNPGSEYSEGILRGVLITLARSGATTYQFTSG